MRFFVWCLFVVLLVFSVIVLFVFFSCGFVIMILIVKMVWMSGCSVVGVFMCFKGIVVFVWFLSFIV